MDQVLLNVDEDNAAGGERLVLVHGFAGNHKSWDSVRPGLSAIGPTLAVDLVGHHPSPAPDDPAAYTMAACLEQIKGALERRGIKRAWWIGYSMGGRVVLNMALSNPALIAGIVLESATPGIEDSAQREERRRMDQERAGDILERGLEVFVDDWLAAPLFAGLRKLPPAEFAVQRAMRMSHTPQGLAHSLRGMGTGAMNPLWERLGEVDFPALVLAGERDEKFTAIARKVAGALPRATLRILPGVGHTLHVEAPGDYLTAVSDFIRAETNRG